jgi:hypothetical protein
MNSLKEVFHIHDSVLNYPDFAFGSFRMQLRIILDKIEWAEKDYLLGYS